MTAVVPGPVVTPILELTPIEISTLLNLIILFLVVGMTYRLNRRVTAMKNQLYEHTNTIQVFRKRLNEIISKMNESK
jgi:hypothetical protein